MKIMVRRAEIKDVNSIYTVVKLAFEEYRRISYKEAAIESAILSKSEIRRRIREGLLLVALVEGQIVGTVTGEIEYGCMHVRSLATHPRFQNLHIGTRLMEEIEKKAAEAKCFKISLFTTPVMKSAIHLYEKLGFEKEGVLRKQFHGIDFVAFGKILHR